jgi:hypothetical protein
MIVISRLFPRTDDEPFLAAREVAERLSTAFPNAVVDNQRAWDLLQAEQEKLEARGTPLPILQGHKNLLGITTSVEIRCPANNNIAVHFLVYPDSPIEVSAIRPKSPWRRIVSCKSLSDASPRSWGMTSSSPPERVKAGATRGRSDYSHPANYTFFCAGASV